jgi:hypothetical protein
MELILKIAADACYIARRVFFHSGSYFAGQIKAA